MKLGAIFGKGEQTVAVAQIETAPNDKPDPGADAHLHHRLGPRSSSRSCDLPGHRSSTQQTTGLHGTMAKVCKSDGEGTFRNAR
jgi:hypothetical protein